MTEKFTSINKQVDRVKTSINNRKDLKIKIYADGANSEDMIAAYKNKLVDGFTTNPSLMRKAGVTDYEKFAKEVLAEIKDVSISFEVFSDNLKDMEREARTIHPWGKNVHVKINSYCLTCCRLFHGDNGSDH